MSKLFENKVNLQQVSNKNQLLPNTYKVDMIFTVDTFRENISET